MKRFILLSLLIGGFCLAQFTPPDSGYDASDDVEGLTMTVYCMHVDGTSTNAMTFTNGIFVAFP